MKTILAIVAILLLPVAAQPAPTVNYAYRAQLDRVVDGDTVILNIDLGFNVWLRERVRLLNVYAAETGKTNGKSHKDNLVKLIPANAALIVQTKKDRMDGYGRMIANIWANGVDVNEAQIKFIRTPQGEGVKL